MVLINTSSDIGWLINSIGSYVLGDQYLVGVWILLVLFGLGAMLNIDFSLLFLLCIPITIVLIATNFIYPWVGGIFILVAAMVLAKNFFFK